jgi:hypothetical protein
MCCECRAKLSRHGLSSCYFWSFVGLFFEDFAVFGSLFFEFFSEFFWGFDLGVLFGTFLRILPGGFG